jgi:hypothetical protein
MQSWNLSADEQILKKPVLGSVGRVNKTIEALKENGINAFVVDNGEEAKRKVLEMIPEGAEVMNMTSVTVDSIGLAAEINESGKFDSVKNKLSKMDKVTQGKEMQRIGAAPEWAIGSVHAVTEDGTLMIGSNSGSQLPGYAYGASHVIWIVGTQKIVKDLDEGMKRIYEHVLPLESERARIAYGVDGSFVSKLLIINRENNKNRINLIFVKEALGY